MFHFNPLTGEDVLGVSVAGDVLQGVDVFSGTLLQAFMFEGPAKAVVLVDVSHQVWRISIE